MKAALTPPADEVLPLIIAPDEFAYYFRERWLDPIESGAGTVSDTVLPYLEDEAIKRIAAEVAVPKEWRPDKHKDREGWRLFWLNEARQNCDSFSPVPRAGRHLSPAGESAVNLLVISSELRDAIDRGRADMACALGMLLVAEVIGGGYSMEVEATRAASDAIHAARRTAYNNGIGRQAHDLGMARKACIEKAKSIWSEDATTLIGQVAKTARLMLKANLDKLPTLTLADIPGIDTIKTWLKTAAGAGELVIPPTAQRRGRPPNKAR